ncbi:MAG TPA: class I SAM-dependent methyltransferase, partial [Polyangiales bacterium]
AQRHSNTRLTRRLARNWAFPGSRRYWESRYAAGGNSGCGSYGRLARFKAEVLNAFVSEHAVRSVLEFGCGDGNQLSLAHYPSYIGLDVSPSALRACSARFAGDRSKSFFLYRDDCFVDNAGVFRAELALSIDVLFHLIEEPVWVQHLGHLFDAATRYVCIYSSDRDHPANAHERHRRFTIWAAQHRPQWKLSRHVPNRYPYDLRDPDNTSNAEFFLFERT